VHGGTTTQQPRRLQGVSSLVRREIHPLGLQDSKTSSSSLCRVKESTYHEGSWTRVDFSSSSSVNRSSLISALWTAGSMLGQYMSLGTNDSLRFGLDLAKFESLLLDLSFSFLNSNFNLL
jgi:hypothetical protein